MARRRQRSRHSIRVAHRLGSRQMHAAVLQLAPILGAEKSKVPFYIAGGLLVAWALTLSLLIGMRKTRHFPGGSKSQQRGVIAVTAVLVLAAVSTAVITSGGSTKTAATAATVTPSPAAESPPPAGGGTSTAGASPQPTSTARLDSGRNNRPRPPGLPRRPPRPRPRRRRRWRSRRTPKASSATTPSSSARRPAR